MANYEEVKAALSGRFSARTYPFPGAPSINVGVKMLSDAELDAVRLQAVSLVKTKQADIIIDPEFLDRAIHRETVARAFVDPDKTDHAFFGSQAEVAELDNLTVRALYELYMSHCQSMDPYAFCPLEQIEELAETLGKSENSVGILNLYDSPTLRSLLLSTALRLREMSPPLN